jgi:hypothetical protein
MLFVLSARAAAVEITNKPRTFRVSGRIANLLIPWNLVGSCTKDEDNKYPFGIPNDGNG